MIVFLTFDKVFLIELSLERDINKIISATNTKSNGGLTIPNIFRTKLDRFVTSSQISKIECFLIYNNPESIVLCARLGHFEEGDFKALNSSDRIKKHSFNLNFFLFSNIKTIHLLGATKEEKD